MELPPSLRTEAVTLAVMVADDCRQRHGHVTPCPACAELIAYAHRRLAACRYGGAKPDCARCPACCHPPARRERLRAVMRAQGPRMLWRHPWLALAHLLRHWRRVPARPGMRSAR